MRPCTLLSRPDATVSRFLSLDALITSVFLAYPCCFYNQRVAGSICRVADETNIGTKRDRHQNDGEAIPAAQREAKAQGARRFCCKEQVHAMLAAIM